MAFSKTTRQYWSQFCERHSFLVNKLPSLPIAFSNPDRFNDLLQRGETSAKDATERLSELSNEEWQAFEMFMKQYRNDWDTYFVETLFPAYFKEVERRVKP